MPADDPVLSRPYAPVDLAGELSACSVTKTVLVQAAPTVEESEYLLGIADATPHVAAVVGWINFEDQTQIATLKRLAAHPRFVGVRPMIQDLPDDNWMLREDIQWAFEALIELDLTFDCLGFPRHLPNFHTLLTRYPELRAVVDHCMKPQLRDHSDANLNVWADGMAQLAADTTACCKLSGVVTEADTDWSEAALAPYVNKVIDSFGASRVMWGSDWPVSRLRCEYRDWHNLARQLTGHLSDSEQQAIFAGTADKFYRL
jgi:L-fuconolactonase